MKAKAMNISRLFCPEYMRKSQTQKVFLLAVSLLLMPAYAEEVVKWVDDQGRVHFGDAPPPDKSIEAEVMEVKEAPKLGLTEQELQEQRNRTRKYEAELERREALKRDRNYLPENTRGESEQTSPSASPSEESFKPQSREECRNMHQSNTAARVRCFKSLDNSSD